MAPSSAARPVAILVTPGTREANNGNWRTARRWAGFLAGAARPIVQTAWDGTSADVMVALHAKRSADSIARFREAFPDRRLVVLLSGTDLYRDLPGSPEARRSLELADAIVALQADALAHVPAAIRPKCTVIHQSARTLPALRKARDRLDCAVVGHLRGEKDPATVWRALDLLPKSLPVRIRHVGDALDPALGAAAREAMARDARYRWLGPLPHGLARGVIRRAHVLVHPSIMEGGANVIVEALTSGTPVLASRMSGNLGMLGPDYPGYFPVGDARALAERLEALATDRSSLDSLAAACRERRRLFAPATERAAVRAIILPASRKVRR